MNEIALNKFFERLKKVKDRKWRLTPSGKIRCENLTCPVNAIAGQGYWLFMKKQPDLYHPEIQALGFDRAEIDLIVKGADYNSPAYLYFEPEVRARLLSILGLSEVEA